MKVKKLKEILSELPDNMDIYLYNGLVEDFVDIKNVTSFEIHKMKPSCLLEIINLQRQIRRQEPLSKSEIRNTTWELPNEEMSVEQLKMFRKKKIMLINSKFKGESSYDRMGTIHY